MRILLIDPPFQRFIGFYRYYFPLGLTYLAAVLKQAGHEVLIYDAEHDNNCISLSMEEVGAKHHLYTDGLQNDLHPIWIEFLEILKDFRPQAVGISVITPKVASAIKMIKIVKEHSRDIIVFSGGEHVTIRPQDVLKKGADYVVIGEGERGILQLFKELGEGGSPPPIIKSEFIEDLDTLPIPALECLKAVSLYERNIDFGLMMDARGCSFNCTSCALAAIWGRRVRYHSIGRLIDEIRGRKTKYGTEYFSFRNGTFTSNRQRVLSFCEHLIREKLNISWECLTRVDTLDADLLERMMDAGCRAVRVGLEFGSEELLKYMNKGITLAQIRQAARILHESGIFWAAFFMIGVPAETEETMKATWDLMRELDPPFITLSRFTPLPGTPMYDEVVKAGLLDEENTDWAWAANQSLGKSFVKGMDEERALALMQEVTAYVTKHNARHAKIRADRRLKTVTV